jgi:hypothetical protein
MKVSGFTFLRNGQKLGYPFVASIRSILPTVDEFVVALGPCDDDTEKMLREIGDPKIRIIPTQWNERIRSDYSLKGFVYGQQKSIALFNCTGDWAFYLEGDEVIHENDLPKIRAAMEKHLDDEDVEALVFDYLHFYGNANTYAWSPAWYRTAPRILRNTIPAWASERAFLSGDGRPQVRALSARRAHRRDDLPLRLAEDGTANNHAQAIGRKILVQQPATTRGLCRHRPANSAPVFRHASQSGAKLAPARRRFVSGGPKPPAHVT